MLDHDSTSSPPSLDVVEARVLGTLVEKAHTVPSQYPMTLNAIVAGANQRNNRFPVEEHEEEQVLDALDRLRGKGFVHEVNLAGSRVPKYRHVARERLGIATGELVVLTELLLRGPQTVGELRGRASRMHPLESTEVVSNILESLERREHPLVERLPPAPGTRAGRHRHLLGPASGTSSPTSGDIAEVPRPAVAASSAAPDDLSDDLPNDLLDRIARLERRVAAIETVLSSQPSSPVPADDPSPPVE